MRSKKDNYSYDEKCRELAQHFLSDYIVPLGPFGRQEAAEEMDKKQQDLAQEIQDTIESFLNTWTYTKEILPR